MPGVKDSLRLSECIQSVMVWAAALKRRLRRERFLLKRSRSSIGYGKDNVSVAAVDQFGGNGVGSVCLIGGTAGVAEARFAAEGNIMEPITMLAVIETVAFFVIATAEHFLNFTLDNRTDAWIRGEERMPVILKNLLDSKS